MQSDPQMIKEIIDAVSIPVMAKARIGHIVGQSLSTELGEFTQVFHRSRLRSCKPLVLTTSMVCELGIKATTY